MRLAPTRIPDKVAYRSSIFFFFLFLSSDATFVPSEARGTEMTKRRRVICSPSIDPLHKPPH